jgi:hypothetical protein
MNPAQIFELCSKFEYYSEYEKEKDTSRNGPNPPAAQLHRTGVAGFNSARVAHGLAGRLHGMRALGQALARRQRQHWP